MENGEMNGLENFDVGWIKIDEFGEGVKGWWVNVSFLVFKLQRQKEKMFCHT